MIIMSKTTQVIQYRYGQINFCKAKKNNCCKGTQTQTSRRRAFSKIKRLLKKHEKMSSKHAMYFILDASSKSACFSYLINLVREYDANQIRILHLKIFVVSGLVLCLCRCKLTYSTEKQSVGVFLYLQLKQASIYPL